MGKLFPSIRYGRDADLERYIMLRESGKSSTEWGGVYGNLSLRYTPRESAGLIRSYRKNAAAFDLLFKKVLDNLYDRMTALLFLRIDRVVRELTQLETLERRPSRRAGERGVIDHLEKIVSLCSPNMETATAGAEFLLETARHFGRKERLMKRALELVRGYTDGTLFEEAQVRETYHFDIREERRKEAPQAGTRREGLKLRILITREDVDAIVVRDDSLNEYERAYAYFERYLPLVDNHEFQTKIYVYSKKHGTPHYRIFDVVRNGVLYGHQRGRTFDDIFKILCAGRYVFDIRSERAMQEKLRSLSSGLPGTSRKKKQGRTPLPASLHDIKA
ncbi:MAG TPA: hypothetical protein ENN69_01200, partial [Spirochaetia bacterium]|nr:hypothetical protein [Spirochaetia bacterium]